MTDEQPQTGLVSDEEIADQLRQYADALATRIPAEPVIVAHDRHGSTRRRRIPLLAIAATLAVLAGAGTWMATRDDADSIQSSTDQPTPGPGPTPTRAPSPAPPDGDDGGRGHDESADEAVTGGGRAGAGTGSVPEPWLPRYVLPEPWTFEWVTDMGLWSTEQRAQQAAVEAARADPSTSLELLMTQGFARTDTEADPEAGANGGDGGAGALPFALPDLVVQVYRRDIEALATGLGPPDGEPISFAGFDGHVTPVQVFDRDAAGGSREDLAVSATQGSLVVTIDAPRVDEATIRAFVDSLEVRDGDATAGFVSTGPFEPLVDLPGVAGWGFHRFARWTAALSAGPARATISVESFTFEQFQLHLVRERGFGAAIEPVDGGRYLAATASGGTIEVDGEMVALPADVTPVTSLLRYDRTRQILVTLHLEDDLDATITLMEELMEVNIETWRQLVEPHNAKPLEPE